MDKKKVIIYGVGGVALVGIALYLYNKNKDTTRSGNELTPPPPIPTNEPTPTGMIVPVLGVTPSGDTSGAYSPNPNAVGGDKFTTSPSTSSVPSTSNVVAVRPSTPSGAGEVVPSTNDVTLFVDPVTTTTPKVSPYTPYVVGSLSYYYSSPIFFTNDVNAILNNASIPLTQKTSAINILRQLAIDSTVSNVAVYGNTIASPLRQSAIDSINSISDTAIANVQSQLNALISTPIRTTPTTTTTTTPSTSSPVLVRGFDGGFSYADGRRYGGRKIGLSGFKNN